MCWGHVCPQALCPQGIPKVLVLFRKWSIFMGLSMSSELIYLILPSSMLSMESMMCVQSPVLSQRPLQLLYV